MKQGYFIENINDETLAELIDETLRFEKNNKTNKIKYGIFKLIPAATAIAIVIGLINLTPMISKKNIGTPGSEAGVIKIAEDTANNTIIITTENELVDIAEEQDYYTYEKYIEFDRIQREFYKSQINCIDENWLPMSGQPVLTQEIYDEHMKNWEEGLEKTLKEIQNGLMIPILPHHSDPYTVFYEMVNPYLDLKCFADKNGNWLLYNGDTTGMHLNESFGTKDEMLEKARWWLSRGTLAGEIDPAWANTIYRRLYFANETVEFLPDAVPGDETVMPIPIAPSSPAMIIRAFERSYRDSTEYTKFIDSTFAQRMNNLSEEESKFIYNNICAGECPPIADDIIGINTDGTMVVLQLESGEIIRFDLNMLID